MHQTQAAIRTEFGIAVIECKGACLILLDAFNGICHFGVGHDYPKAAIGQHFEPILAHEIRVKYGSIDAVVAKRGSNDLRFE